jgi:hypothetical protein
MASLHRSTKHAPERGSTCAAVIEGKTETARRLAAARCNRATA